ncbi:MAG TPA: hypothetical protein DEP84_33665 [Chloroflexi bacterium]|nr:hypothetical protein [Chloroflexota bacterium]
MTRLILPLLLATILVLGPVAAVRASPPAQLPLADPAQSLFTQLTPEERIGQLFVVAFMGRDLRPGSQIATLLQEDKIGGVVLLAADGNFRNSADAPKQIAALAEGLQGLVTGPRGATGIPLLIAVDHEGDGYPYSRITGGVTPLASPMAIGATWDPALAEATGYAAGLELAAMGINMLLGPSVDVLHDPRPSSKGDLGVRTFGGDPFWVGRMGRAYIRGIHEGSQGRVVTVAKHFPGHGGSDRLPDDEVATVDKSLQELRRIELAPFFAITGIPAGWSPDVTDALMTSHIRYRGFQGDNIRQFTAPISFDPTGLRTILGLPEFDTWREQGVMVSDALGVPAVRKYFDPTLKRFPHRQIAREALNAGNDLLILAQYDLNDHWADQYANIRDTVAFFREQYEADNAFRARVDEAALKVLRLKMRLYPDLEKGRGKAVLPLTNPSIAGRRSAVTETVARGALTLIYPRTPADLAARLPVAPRRGESIVIFTDSREVRDCFDPDCQPFRPLPVDALQQAILRLYGPLATNEVSPDQIVSFSFGDLKTFLGSAVSVTEDAPVLGTQATATANPPATTEPVASSVGAALQTARWVILVMQDVIPASNDSRPGVADSDAARIFLDTAADSLFDRKIVAFALNVPYQLDTTEISKLTAYFGLYSKQPAFVEIAARALFKDATPVGAPPVSVEAINYDLTTQLQPDPARPLPLRVAATEPLTVPAEAEVVVGPVLDRNGHIVPDGTAVEVWGAWEADGAVTPRVQAPTLSGLATLRLSLTQGGRLTVHATSFGASSQEPLMLKAEGAVPPPTMTVTVTVTPTLLVTAEPQPTLTPGAMAKAGPTATRGPSLALANTSPPTAPAGEVVPPSRPTTRPSMADLVAALVGIGVMASGALLWTRALTVQSVRRATLVVIGGLAAYISYSLGWWGSGGEPLAALRVSLVGGGIGLVLGLLWRVGPALKMRG